MPIPPVSISVRLGFAALAASLLAGCSPLSLFATFTPKDPAPRRASGLAYGPGPRQALDVYPPPAATAGPAPIAVFFYGGGWDSGRRQDYGWAGRSLAAQGFLTVVPDYRIYPQARFPAFLEDGAAALRWAQDHGSAFGGDPTRIVLVGHSAGAYNAVMLALDERYLRHAGADPGRIRAVAGLAGPYDFLPLKSKITLRAFGAAPDLKATQPIAFARRAAPPMFLAAGDDDRLVGPYNARHLAAALRAAGAEVEERHYPGMDHPGSALALSRPFRARSPLFAEMTDFLRRHANVITGPVNSPRP